MSSLGGRTALRSTRRSATPPMQPQFASSTTDTRGAMRIVRKREGHGEGAATGGSGGFLAYSPMSILGVSNLTTSSSDRGVQGRVGGYILQQQIRAVSSIHPKWRQLFQKVIKSSFICWGAVVFCGIALFMTKVLTQYIGATGLIHSAETAAARRRLRLDLVLRHGVGCHCTSCKAVGLEAISSQAGLDAVSSLNEDSESSLQLNTSSLSANEGSYDGGFVSTGGFGNSGEEASLSSSKFVQAMRKVCGTPVVRWVTEQHPLLTTLSVLLVTPVAVEVFVGWWFHSLSRRYNTHMSSMWAAQLASAPSSSSPSTLATNNPSEVGMKRKIVDPLTLTSRGGTRRRKYAPEAKWANLSQSSKQSVPTATTATTTPLGSAPLSSPPAWGRARGRKLLRQLLFSQRIYASSHIVCLFAVGITLEVLYIAGSVS